MEPMYLPGLEGRLTYLERRARPDLDVADNVLSKYLFHFTFSGPVPQNQGFHYLGRAARC